MYLLDTMVLSELRKRQPHPGVAAWLAEAGSEELFVSAISVCEVELGIEQRRRPDPAFAARLEQWLNGVLHAYGDRILPVDSPVARRWGQLAARLGNRDFDLALAATALEHRLTVVTRNVSHFAPAGVATLNPFD
jgi:predicted nucleic acid-binding protein